MKRLPSRTICSVVHEVFECTPDEMPELVDENGDISAGIAHPWFAKIYVRSGATPSCRDATIDHEAFHCLIYHSGLRHVLRDVMKVKRYDEVEETIIQLLTPYKGSL